MLKVFMRRNLSISLCLEAEVPYVERRLHIDAVLQWLLAYSLRG
jgi:hypothetical protein